MQVKKQQLESDVEQLTGSKLGEEYNNISYCHPAYLTYMQSAGVYNTITVQHCNLRKKTSQDLGGIEK